MKLNVATVSCVPVYNNVPRQLVHKWSLFHIDRREHSLDRNIRGSLISKERESLVSGSEGRNELSIWWEWSCLSELLNGWWQWQVTAHSENESLFAATRHAKKPARVPDSDCGVRSGLYLKTPGHIIYILGGSVGCGFLVVCLHDGSILVPDCTAHSAPKWRDP